MTTAIKCTIDDTAALASAVAWAGQAVPAKPQPVILAGMMVTFGEAEVTFAGFGGDLSAVAAVPCVTQEGAGTRFLLPGRMVELIARQATAGKPVTVTAGPGGPVRIAAGAGTFQLAVMPDEDYPALPPLPQPCGAIAGDLLTEALGQTIIAAKRDASLEQMRALRLEFAEKTVTVVASDGYRIAVREIPWTRSRAADLPGAVLLPLGPAAALMKGLPAEEEISVSVAARDPEAGPDLAGFSCRGRRMTTRLAAGEWPAWRSYVAHPVAAAATVAAGDLLAALAATALVQPERGAKARLEITAGAISVSAATADGAAAADADLAAAYEGDDLDVAFNPHYLTDAVRGTGAAGEDLVRLGLRARTASGKLPPVIITGELPGDDAEPSYSHSVMPYAD